MSSAWLAEAAARRRQRVRIAVAASGAALSLGILACSHAPRSADGAERSAALEHAVGAESPPFAQDVGARARPIWRETRRFYQRHDFRLAWTDGRVARPAMDSLVRSLRASAEEGLDPARYRVDALDAFRQHVDPSKAADADVECTWAFLLYAWDLTHGATAPEDVDRQWRSARGDVDLQAALDDALTGNRVDESLHALAPTAPPYQGLRHQLSLRHGGQGDDDAERDQIRANMDRWRWLPQRLGDRYVTVNIPAYRLDVVENDRSVLAMKVVVGTKSNPTPVLADEMTTIVFSPYWNIPDDIAAKEIQPKVEQDPGYLDKHNMEYDAEGRHFRQRPGQGNSLGFVKFLFPNHFNVYMHDTPARSFFERVERDFSHGCVRLERPMELAKYVLRDRPEWTEEKIDAAMHRGVEQAVPLKTALPVYLVYFTAWEENGELRTVPDLYGYDRRQLARAVR
ncbi:MAG TPA: L,D-transpeptidase family protein [Vicinamibacterales bacterium]|nr:L,D-transpeptidase family protein [Vicinamibacterales bacterium]